MKRIRSLVLVLVAFAGIGPSAPAIASDPPPSALPPSAITNPTPIPPGQAVGWLTAKVASLSAVAQAAATPVATVAVIVAGFALMVGWLFSARFLRVVAQWLLGGILVGYFLVMAAPRLVAVLQGVVAR